MARLAPLAASPSRYAYFQSYRMPRCVCRTTNYRFFNRVFRLLVSFVIIGCGLNGTRSSAAKLSRQGTSINVIVQGECV
jgi:hypothetical protein